MNLWGPAVDLADLVLARSCVRCGTLGRVLCDGCLEGRRGHVHPVPQVAPGLPAFAALDYDDGGGRDLVLAYKEHGIRSLAPMLGTLLADAVESAARALASPALQIVPVPAHRRSARGFDAVAGILRWAQLDLARRGLDGPIVRAVRTSGGGAVMKSLSGEQRRAQAVHRFHPGRQALRPSLPVIVVDDVITTGSTVNAVLQAMPPTVDPVRFGVAAVTAVTRPGNQPGYVGSEPRTRSVQAPASSS